MTDTTVSSPERRVHPDRTPPSRVSVPMGAVAASVDYRSFSRPAIVLGARPDLVAVFSVGLHDWLVSRWRRLHELFRPVRWLSDTVRESILSLAPTARPLILPLLAALTVGRSSRADRSRCSSPACSC